jgi:LacI family transcriptional regulator
MKRIAILVETSLASGRQIVTGISRFLDEHNDWSVFQHSGPLGAMDPTAINQWEGDGIIARIANQELLTLIQSKGLPTVDVLGNVSPLAFPLVKCNDKSIGASVAKHFIENAHTNFGFIGLSDERWSVEREIGFKREINNHNGEAHSYHINQHRTKQPPAGDSLDSVKAWLASLQTPIGLMVASDQFAPIVFEACHQLGLSIPENVSVVGVDNDRPFCNLCRPRLSSVEPNHELVGYRAAQTLEQLINGEALKRQVIEINPHTLHQRLSSDLIAINDPALRKALNYIRGHACAGTSLDAIARGSGLSRSVLQRRFRQKLNRTVGDVILAEKLRTAREMLSNTQLPIAQVAERSGFNCQEYMNHIFQKHLHTTPRKYRMR